MRTVTQRAAQAFLLGKTMNQGNTAVTADEQGSTQMLLHGNLIADHNEFDTVLTLAGWPTVTTRERLNGLLAMLGSPLRFCQKGGKQYVVDVTTGELSGIGAHDKLIVRRPARPVVYYISRAEG
jgi:hypothetical protein